MVPSISVAEYYANKSIFITGATGFMGHVLVEKLLRTCPDIKKIYLLMRSKKGQNSNERLDKYFNSEIFDQLRKEHPKYLEKISLIQGDILLEELGISVEDRGELQRECQIVVHCAASVRFDMFIRDAVKINVAGTHMVLELSAGMEKLEVFMHVSTAFCGDVDVLEDKLYPGKYRPQDIIQCCNWMDDKILLDLEPLIIKPHPNTYGYTKSLAEDLVSQYSGKFPIVIARPSIVTPTLMDPIPGWINNLNGPTGMLVAAAKGVLRTMLINLDHSADTIPVDIVINACILLTYTTAIDKSKEIRVCNITIGSVNPISWGNAIEAGLQHLHDFPYTTCLWYPGGAPTSSWLEFQFRVFFTHKLPAYFIDLLLYILGYKTFMVQVQKRISYGLNILQYYTMQQWNFKNDDFMALKKAVSEEDNQTYFTDISIIDWSQYTRSYVKGTRQYCLKEDPASIPQAKKLFQRLYYLDLIVSAIIYALIGYFIYFIAKVLFSDIL